MNINDIVLLIVKEVVGVDKMIKQLNILKPMIPINSMVEYLKRKNIKFEKILEQDAEKYLRENNNYYNLT